MLGTPTTELHSQLYTPMMRDAVSGPRATSLHSLLWGAAPQPLLLSWKTKPCCITTPSCCVFNTETHRTHVVEMPGDSIFSPVIIVKDLCHIFGLSLNRMCHHHMWDVKKRQMFPGEWMNSLLRFWVWSRRRQRRPGQKTGMSSACTGMREHGSAHSLKVLNCSLKKDGFHAIPIIAQHTLEIIIIGSQDFPSVRSWAH